MSKKETKSQTNCETNPMYILIKLKNGCLRALLTISLFTYICRQKQKSIKQLLINCILNDLIEYLNKKN